MSAQRAEWIPQNDRKTPAETQQAAPGEGLVIEPRYRILEEEKAFPSLPALAGRASLVAVYWSAVGVAVGMVSLVYVFMWLVSQLSRMATEVSRRSVRGVVQEARHHAPRVTPLRDNGHGHGQCSGGNVHVDVNVSGHRSGRVHVNVNVN